tara:strand:+ start:233 stop:400 length:168 start_codon:yes stop_codon:yes gene_type:complete
MLNTYKKVEILEEKSGEYRYLINRNGALEKCYGERCGMTFKYVEDWNDHLNNCGE